MSYSRFWCTVPTFKSPLYLPKKYERRFFCCRPNPHNTYAVNKKDIVTQGASWSCQAVLQWWPYVTSYSVEISLLLGCGSGLIDGHCGLDVGCVLRRICRVFFLGNRQYPSDKVTMSIIVSVGAIGAAASMPNWSLCRIVRSATSLGDDIVWRRQKNWRNKTARLVFLHNGTSRINWSWQLPPSYGRHGAPLLAFKYTTISKHTMQQDYTVKTKKTIFINVD